MSFYETTTRQRVISPAIKPAKAKPQLFLHLTREQLRREVQLRRREREIRIERLHDLIQQHSASQASFPLICAWRREIVELLAATAS